MAHKMQISIKFSWKPCFSVDNNLTFDFCSECLTFVYLFVAFFCVLESERTIDLHCNPPQRPSHLQPIWHVLDFNMHLHRFREKYFFLLGFAFALFIPQRQNCCFNGVLLFPVLSIRMLKIRKLE